MQEVRVTDQPRERMQERRRRRVAEVLSPPCRDVEMKRPTRLLRMDRPEVPMHQKKQIVSSKMCEEVVVPYEDCERLTEGPDAPCLG